jgi:hypothetical protein
MDSQETPSSPDPLGLEDMDTSDLRTGPHYTDMRDGTALASSPINIRSSPDPLNSFGQPPHRKGPFGHTPNTPTPVVPQKRATEATSPDVLCPPPPRTQFSFSAQPLPMPEPRTAEEALAMARNLIVKATALTLLPEKQTLLLDFLEVFRDFTENGRVNKHGLTALASQITSLETVSRGIGAKVRQLQKTTPSTTTTTTPNTPAEHPMPQTDPRTIGQGNLSYAAAAAARTQPAAPGWQQVGKKKTATPLPKESLANRKLVLVQENLQPFNSLELRNAFNQAFATKGVLSPVVASVTSSKRQNIVITTTPAFTAKYLLEKKDIWETLVHFKTAQPIQPWYKVAIHNIPTSFSTNESLSILKSEITTFNKGFEIVSNPYWLTREERRTQQLTGTVCIAFATEQEAQRAIHNKLYLLGCHGTNSHLSWGCTP